MIFKHAKTAGFVYQAVLREELTRRLGVEWTEPKNGVADIEGIPRRVIDHFSQRRGEILSSMGERGERSARAAQIAALDTRKSKQQLTLGADQRATWRHRAVEQGLDLRALDGLLDRAVAQPHHVDVDALLGPRGLTRQSSTFQRLDVVQALANAARGGASAHSLGRAADAVLDDERVVSLQDGRFSTRELLDLELGLLSSADERSNDPAPTDCAVGTAQALTQRPTMSDDQRRLVERVVRGNGATQVVLAPAGTGKTFALDAAREAWQRHGVPVLGCALSARAASELREQAGLDATTIARLRIALEGGARLTPDSVLVVDEAGMVGTRDLAALAAAATDAGARLVLVGDDRQLPEIDAGGAFRALARQQDAAALTEVRRQEEPWDRAALTELRDGDIDAFARAYEQHGRVTTAPTADSLRSTLVDDWAAARARGADALMLAHRRADVADLNQRARLKLQAAGLLGPDELVAGRRAFGLGDDVVATHNDSRLGVYNSMRGHVTGIDSDGLEVTLRNGSPLALPGSYLENEHLDHAYALTAHRAQGATVDETFVLGSDELYREWAYTALSRHRARARFYLSASPAFLNTPAPALTVGEDVAPAVAATLRPRRLEFTATEQRADAHLALAEVEQRVADLRAELGRTSRLRRGRREELEAEIAEAEGRLPFARFKVERHDTAHDRAASAPADPHRPEDPLASLMSPDLSAPVSRARTRPTDDIELEL